MPCSKLISFVPLLLLAAVVGSAAVSKPLDPLYVAPHIYEQVLKNDKVRVLKQKVRAGEIQSVHAHPDRVMVYLQTCAWLESDGAGGERMQQFKFGDVVWAPSETHGGTSRDVVQDCIILEVELL